MCENKLWPEKLPESWFEEQRRMITPRDYEREVMQIPMPSTEDEIQVAFDPATNRMITFWEGRML